MTASERWLRLTTKNGKRCGVGKIILSEVGPERYRSVNLHLGRWQQSSTLFSQYEWGECAYRIEEISEADAHQLTEQLAGNAATSARDEPTDHTGRTASVGASAAAAEVASSIERSVTGVPGAAVPGGSASHAVKPLQSLERKVATQLRAAEAALSLDDVLEELPDALRYTFVVRDRNYTKAVEQLVKRLKGAGLAFDCVNNAWTRECAYQGINVAFMYGSHRLEVQFHTPGSLELREQMFPLYEICRLPSDVMARAAGGSPSGIDTKEIAALGIELRNALARRAPRGADRLTLEHLRAIPGELG
jgi:hypothetical protein